jgi:hypothetical protein
MPQQNKKKKKEWKQIANVKYEETIGHVISACPVLAKEKYISDMI